MDSNIHALLLLTPRNICRYGNRDKADTKIYCLDLMVHCSNGSSQQKTSLKAEIMFYFVLQKNTVFPWSLALMCLYLRYWICSDCQNFLSQIYKGESNAIVYIKCQKFEHGWCALAGSRCDCRVPLWLLSLLIGRSGQITLLLVQG